MSELVKELGSLGVKEEVEVSTNDAADATTEVEERVSSDKLMIRERTQINIKCDEKNKKDIFNVILESIPSSQTMVFCKKRETCDELVAFLKTINVEAKPMYSYGRDQKQLEDRVKDDFKKRDLRVMVCTDYVARGYDVPCELVICYDLPYIFDEQKRAFSNDVEFEQYAHRTARTARAGRFGTIINLVAGTRDSLAMDSIADRFKMRIVGHSETAALSDIVFKEWKSDEDSIRDLQDYIDKRKEEVHEMNDSLLPTLTRTRTFTQPPPTAHIPD